MGKRPRKKKENKLENLSVFKEKIKTEVLPIARYLYKKENQIKNSPVT